MIPTLRRDSPGEVRALYLLKVCLPVKVSSHDPGFGRPEEQQVAGNLLSFHHSQEVTNTHLGMRTRCFNILYISVIIKFLWLYTALAYQCHIATFWWSK